MPFVSPIGPDNRPIPVAGDVNGEMPARDLVGVAKNCVASRAAGPSLGLLLATARNEGVVLGTEQCYRPLSDEVAVRQHATAAGNSSCAAPVVTSPSGAAKGTSMHGWGKAADFSDIRGSVAFGSPGDHFLNAAAGRFGWNHPGWARPGGSTCPEAWHWEWVGDGGIRHASPVRADVIALLPSRDDRGYSTVTGLGALEHRGDAPDYGRAYAFRLRADDRGLASYSEEARVTTADFATTLAAPTVVAGPSGSWLFYQYAPDASTGSSARTAVSSRLATRVSSRRTVLRNRPSRSSGWPQLPTAAATGWHRPAEPSPPSVTLASTARPRNRHLP